MWRCGGAAVVAAHVTLGEHRYVEEDGHVAASAGSDSGRLRHYSLVVGMAGGEQVRSRRALLLLTQHFHLRDVGCSGGGSPWCGASSDFNGCVYHARRWRWWWRRRCVQRGCLMCWLMAQYAR
jgi:hypothetical protein